MEGRVWVLGRHLIHPMECYEPGYSTWLSKARSPFSEPGGERRTIQRTVKGKLNFLTPGNGPGPLNYLGRHRPRTKRLAIFSAVRRPTRPTPDTGMYGTGVLYSRANKETVHYIGKLPDAKPQESLTATLKAFSVPVSTPRSRGHYRRSRRG